MRTIQLTWTAACAGSYPVSAERAAISMADALCASGGPAGVHMTRVRHVAWRQRPQGRSVFGGTSPLAPITGPVQANLRPDMSLLNDGKVVLNGDCVTGPDPWRPPPV
jgi:hypothetical protein